GYHLAEEGDVVYGGSRQQQPTPRSHQRGEISQELAVVEDMFDDLEAEDLVVLAKFMGEAVELAKVANLEPNTVQPDGSRPPFGPDLLIARVGECGHLVSASRRVHRECAVAAARIEGAHR